MKFPKKEDEYMNIHLVEPLNHFVKLQDNVWESGSWKLDEVQAKKLVGGEIYFHKKRLEPSFYGGTILGYRVHQEGENQGRIVFKLQYSLACRNVSTNKSGWNKLMKITQLEQ
jgi:hypothetical protein